jgi:hypothetical protein
MAGTSSTEVDLVSKLYPLPRPMHESADEIQRANASYINPPVVRGNDKKKSGSSILSVPTFAMPGNFGCRMLDQILPNSDISAIFKLRRSHREAKAGIVTFAVPECMPACLEVDMLTDEESDCADDETGGFSMPVPDLSELISQFEEDDPALVSSSVVKNAMLNKLKMHKV